MGMSAIVLAGGKGKRLNRNKALVTIGNRTIIEIIVERIEDLFDEVMSSISGCLVQLQEASLILQRARWILR